VISYYISYRSFSQ